MKKQSLIIALAIALSMGLPHKDVAMGASIDLHQDRSITEVLKQVETRFGIRFNYESDVKNLKIKNNFNINSLKRSEIEKFLKDVTLNQISVEKIENNAYVIRQSKSVGNARGAGKTSGVQQKLAPQQALQGTVVDASTNEPIISATVRLKAGDRSTQTDAQGRFFFKNVGQQAVVSVSSMGYHEVELTISDNQIIKLTKDNQMLEEVVITALGIKREQKALGYAVQDIKGDQLQKVKGVDVGTTLTGRIAGLRVFNSTEFNKMPSISLRGMSPILVIDGVYYENLNLRDVPVDNIENISVLKGATATALYGSMGAGGAIMVTTKKGLDQKGVEITASTNNMFFSGYLALPDVQSSYSAGYGGKYNTDDEVWGDKLDIGRVYEQWNPLTKQMEESELTSKGKNNFNNFLEPGLISNNSVSFTNQGENGSIRTAINHIYNKGQYPNTKLNMTNISVSGETKISEKISLESRFGYNRRYAPNDFGAGYNAQGYIYNILVWTGPEYDLSQYKDYWLVENEQQNWHYRAWYDNPYLSAYEKLSSELVNKLNAAVTLNYKVNDWSKIMLRSGYDYYGNTQQQTNPMGIYGTRGGYTGYHNKGKYWTNKTDGYATTNDLIFTANKSFSDFTIDGLAGAAIFYRRDNGLVASTVNGISIPGFYSLRNSIDPISATESKNKEMINSIYGRLSLSWKNAIFIEATGRNDWSSTLPEENKSFFYPSVSGSIVISDLIKDYKPNWLSLLKVRSSWAVTKAVPTPYEIRQSFAVTSNVWDGKSTAAYPNSIKDFSISPTQRDMTEIGADIALFDNRLYGNYTRYFRRLHNVTTYATISSTSGFSSRLINTNEQTMTKGHEITLGGTAVKKEKFKWDIVGNLSQNLTYYHKLDPEYSADALYVKVGERTDHYVTRDWERTPEGEIIHNDSGMPISATHQPRLFGYTGPQWFWGLTNQVSYKDFALSFSFDGRIKGLSYSNMNARLWQTGAHPDSDSPERYEEVVNGNRTFIGPGVKIVSGSVAYDKYGQITSDDRVFEPNDEVVSYENYWKRAYSGTRNIWDETFIKLREVSLNYYVPASIANKFKAKKASVGITGQNLFLWTKEYRFSDPDNGSEDLNSPSMRYLGFNVNLTF
ncbi:SusC/RagA family TonB-linked outer membrane protein [Sphingobacterium shayense]|uniref:SusC/RagA family TonB-linked outer membrane protein n=1 Tax=Sphingobacterium shayense TaxID=626343 RepID=UPI001FE2D435|nr:SusC/RagA family TonB-linked outer membrane protein [Sphingobacterium shayense]